MSEELKLCPVKEYPGLSPREELRQQIKDWLAKAHQLTRDNMESISLLWAACDHLKINSAESVMGIHATENEPLTLDELRGRNKPVWVCTPDAPWIEDGGYYCLCNRGLITPPSMVPFKAGERDWNFYDHKPEGEM